MELMIVLLLMGIMMSLVGPMVVNVVHKAEAQTERLRLESLIKRASFQAFASGSGGSLTLFDNRVEGRFAKQSLRVIEFKALHFPRQLLHFSKAGFPDQRQLTVELPGKILTLNLNHIIDGKGKVVDAVQ